LGSSVVLRNEVKLYRSSLHSRSHDKWTTVKKVVFNFCGERGKEIPVS
jgi:hypothetical protein